MERITRTFKTQKMKTLNVLNYLYLKIGMPDTGDVYKMYLDMSSKEIRNTYVHVLTDGPVFDVIRSAHKRENPYITQVDTVEFERNEIITVKALRIITRDRIHYYMTTLKTTYFHLESDVQDPVVVPEIPTPVPMIEAPKEEKPVIDQTAVPLIWDVVYKDDDLYELMVGYGSSYGLVIPFHPSTLGTITMEYIRDGGADETLMLRSSEYGDTGCITYADDIPYVRGWVINDLNHGHGIVVDQETITSIIDRLIETTKA